MNYRKHFKFRLLPVLILLVLCLVFYEAQYKGKQLPVDLSVDEELLVGATDEPFISQAGISYGKDPSPRFDTRLDHVMAHTKPDDSKPIHSMFIETDREAIVVLLDEAWKKRGPPARQGGANGRDKYDVPMGRVIGKDGERNIRLIMEADSAMLITAYPVR